MKVFSFKVMPLGNVVVNASSTSAPPNRSGSQVDIKLGQGKAVSELPKKLQRRLLDGDHIAMDELTHFAKAHLDKNDI